MMPRRRDSYSGLSHKLRLVRTQKRDVHYPTKQENKA